MCLRCAAFCSRNTASSSQSQSLPVDGCTVSTVCQHHPRLVNILFCQFGRFWWCATPVVRSVIYSRKRVHSFSTNLKKNPCWQPSSRPFTKGLLHVWATYAPELCPRATPHALIRACFFFFFFYRRLVVMPTKWEDCIEGMPGYDLAADVSKPGMFIFSI